MRKRVLITGASAGIGAQTARLLLRSGWDVAAMARREAELERLAAVALAEGGKVLLLPCDLGDRAATDAALGRLQEAWPELDAVVLNAGANVPTPLMESETRAFDLVMEVNLASPLRILRELVPGLSEGARIVGVASVLGRFGIPDHHAYCASKAGLIGLMRALARDLAPRRITVNAVVPGWVDTDMASSAITAQAPGMGMSPEEARAFFVDLVPLQRMLRPDEVAAQVLHLLSPSAGGITGQCLVADCGAMA